MRLAMDEECERGISPGRLTSSPSTSSTVVQWHLDKAASEDVAAALSLYFLVVCLVLVWVCLPFPQAGIVLVGRLSESYRRQDIS